MHPSAGGPPVVVDHWCAELQRRSCEVEVLTTNAYATTGDTSWEVHYRSAYPITVLSSCGPRGYGYSRRMSALLRRKLRSCDLVHVHNVWSCCNRLAAVHCVAAGVPFVVSTHGMLDPHSMGRKPWKKQVYGRFVEFPALRKAAAVIFTHQEEERLARITCARLPTGHVVSLGTEEPPSENRAQLTDSFLTRFPQLQDSERIVFLGRLHSKKGLDLLVPAFAEVAKHRSNVKLILAGPGDDSYRKSLIELSKSLHIQDRVCFTGALSGQDKWAALAAADVYVLPSYQENFVISLVEALRVETPVVCSRRVNIWSDLKAADAVSVCELSTESVAKSILGLLQNPGHASDQGKRGANFAAANYTWTRSVDRLVEVYDNVVGLRERRPT